MKKNLAFTFVFFLFHIVCFSQPGAVGHLNILSERGMKFFVVLNGQQLNNIPQNNIRIENLDQPFYHVQIVFENRMLQPVWKEVLAVADAAGEFRDVTYAIKRYRNNSIGFNFVSMLPVQRSHMPNVYVINYEPRPIADHQNAGCVNRRPMPERDFTGALANVKSQKFDDTRLKVAQQIVSANCMTSEQITQLTDTFAFDESKLDFAKYAYDFCVDRGNYFKVNNVFKFSSSIESLSDYIQSKN